MITVKKIKIIIKIIMLFIYFIIILNLAEFFIILILNKILNLNKKFCCIKNFSIFFNFK